MCVKPNLQKPKQEKQIKEWVYLASLHVKQGQINQCPTPLSNQYTQ